MWSQVRNFAELKRVTILADPMFEAEKQIKNLIILYEDSFSKNETLMKYGKLILIVLDVYCLMKPTM